MNGSVTKSLANKRNKSVVVFNSVARLSSTVLMEEERRSNYPNFKENQVLTFKKYNDMHISNQREFKELTKKE